MRHSFEEVRQLAHALPEDQRIQLANSLYESVASDEERASEAEIEAAWATRSSAASMRSIPGP